MSATEEKLPVLIAVDDDAEAEPDGDRGIEEQALWHRGKTKTVAVDVDPAVLSKSIEDISTKLEQVLANQTVSRRDRGFTVESFTVGLAVSATGKVFLIAEAGIEASIQISFKRSGN